MSQNHLQRSKKSPSKIPSKNPCKSPCKSPSKNLSQSQSQSQSKNQPKNQSKLSYNFNQSLRLLPKSRRQSSLRTEWKKSKLKKTFK